MKTLRKSMQQIRLGILILGRVLKMSILNKQISLTSQRNSLHFPKISLKTLMYPQALKRIYRSCNNFQNHIWSMALNYSPANNSVLLATFFFVLVVRVRVKRSTAMRWIFRMLLMSNLKCSVLIRMRIKAPPIFANYLRWFSRQHSSNPCPQYSRNTLSAKPTWDAIYSITSIFTIIPLSTTKVCRWLTSSWDAFSLLNIPWRCLMMSYIWRTMREFFPTPSFLWRVLLSANELLILYDIQIN